MGWFWSATSSSEAKAPSSEPAAAAPKPAQTAVTSASQTGENNLLDDPEVRKFMSFFQDSEPDVPQKNAPSQQTTAAASQPTAAEPEKPSMISSWKSWSWSSSSSSSIKTTTTINGGEPSTTTTVHSSTHSGSSGPPEEDAVRERSLGEAVLPVTMSCRQAFDLAWGCQGPAGQFRSVYRHGGPRPCSELWDDFWFCMRVKSYAPGPAKEEVIREHYREKERKKYYEPGQPSSEDIWRARTLDEVLAPGEVFQHSFKDMLAANDRRAEEAREAEDARQIREDIERRRIIREQMRNNSSGQSG